MKPILFNTDMVRAILEGRKTVTRRVVKPQPVWNGCEMRWFWKNVGWWFEGWDPIETITWKHTPYRPGDILYVREAWGYKIYPDGVNAQRVYKADGDKCSKWRPSIHMPREAARIFLRVTDVRVDRLQEITNEQAIREGIEPHEIMTNNAGTYIEYRIPGTHDVCPEAWGAFTHLWNSTIKPADRALYGWEANPWVWVIEFEQCEKPAEVREAKR